MIARCSSCGVEFDVELKPRNDPFALPKDHPDPLQAAGAVSGGTPAPFGVSDPASDARKVAGAVELPRGFKLDTSDNRLRISWRWWSPAHLFIMVFAAFWDTFMVIWYSIAIVGQQWQMAAVGTIHGAVGVGLAYYAITGLVNRTRVTLSANQVAVEHGPLPWPGSRALDRAEVEQLYVSRQETQNKGQVNVSFSLQVLLRGGQEVAIVSGLESADQARFLESRIEAALGIEDRAMPGEYRG